MKKLTVEEDRQKKMLMERVEYCRRYMKSISPKLRKHRELFVELTNIMNSLKQFS